MTAKKFILTTVGSTGDVVPFHALALVLLAQGHQVRVVSHSFHEDYFLAAKIPFTSVGLKRTVADFNRLVDQAAQKSAPIQQFEVLVHNLFLADAQNTLTQLSTTMADADRVICQRFDYLGQAAAIQQNKIWASVTLAPQLIKTLEAPVYPAPNLGRWWTQFTWMTLEQLAEPINRQIAEVLQGLGLHPRPLDVAGATSPLLDLVAASPHLSPRRGDWPKNTVMTGPWLLAPTDFTPEPALATFLARYPEPVVVTFGSMGGAQNAAASRLILDALVRLGRPALVQTGYMGLLENQKLPPYILSIGRVPHDFLFSRASVIVHHGGAGTSHAAVRSGRPSVVVPHLFDQYYWAGRLHECGVAPKPIFWHQLNAKKLAAQIAEATNCTRAAQSLGRVVAAEDGVAQALAALERLA